jgi:hypothetical protein
MLFPSYLTAFARIPPKVERTMEQKDNRDDITVLLEHELARIVKRLSAPRGWPGNDNVQKLFTKADDLFM